MEELKKDMEKTLNFFKGAIITIIGGGAIAIFGAFIDVQMLKADMLQTAKKADVESVKNQVNENVNTIKEIRDNTVWLKERWIEKYGRK